MEFNTYDPSKYATDFSWIGRIGDSIAKFAYQMPELIQLNRTIKENNKAKEIFYSSVNKYIDKLDPKIVSNIVSSMKLDVSGDPSSATYDEAARKTLKKNIPTFTNNTKNEDYTNSLVNYFVPILKAAQSDAGGGKLSYGDLLAGLDNNALQEGVNKTTYGQQGLEEQKYQLDQTRNDSEYNKSLERKLGPNGELQRTNELNNQSALTLDQAKSKADQTTKDERNTKFAPIVEAAIKSGMSSDRVYADVFAKTNDPQTAKDAAAQVQVREQNDLKEELQRLQNEARAAIEHKKDLPKVYDISKIDDDINAVSANIAKYDEMMKNSKNIDAKEKAEFQGTLGLLKKQLNIYTEIKKQLIMNPKVTQEDYNKINANATQKVEHDVPHQEMIDKYNRGEYRSMWLSREAEKNKFIENYKKKFGETPTVKEIENATMGGSTTPQTVAQPTSSPSTPNKIGGYDSTAPSSTPTTPTDSAQPINVDGWTQDKVDSLPTGTKIIYKGKVYIAKGKK